MTRLSELSRRGILAAGASAMMAGASHAQDASAGARRWRGATIINALGGLSNPNDTSGGPEQTRFLLDARSLADARASGVTAVNWTIGHVFGDGDPYEITINDIAIYDRMIRDQSRHLIKVLSASDIDRAKRDGKVGIMYGFQNTAMLGDKLARIDTFVDLGVRVFQLTYNLSNAVGDGSMVPENRGISEFGRQVIERLNANNVMVDLSHSGQNTCLEAARASARPISINHTGCRALTDLPRNKTDEELRLVAERGGFIGIYFMPFLHESGHARAEHVVAHIEHAVNICGEDAIGIGTDGDVTQIDDLGAYAAMLAEVNRQRVAAGIAAPGERADTYPFVVDLRGPTQFYDLAERLRARGHARTRIEKILGRNFLRYARDIWGS
ncbi:MAG: dipeptidase [Hyphomonadaceae bacterium]